MSALRGGCLVTCPCYLCTASLEDINNVTCSDMHYMHNTFLVQSAVNKTLKCVSVISPSREK